MHAAKASTLPGTHVVHENLEHLGQFNPALVQAVQLFPTAKKAALLKRKTEPDHINKVCVDRYPNSFADPNVGIAMTQQFIRVTQHAVAFAGGESPIEANESIDASLVRWKPA
jgi:hypothetical protein